LTTEEEKKLGKQIVLEIEKSVEWVKDPVLLQFLDKTGRALVTQVGPTPFEFKFYMIHASDPNAFAIPGGHVFVTTGLLVLSESEEEVAGVLSHEISHVTGRHISRLIEKTKGINYASLAALVAGVLVGGGGKASEAVAAMALGLKEAYALKYTREMEVDADQNALQYLLKAGYDPSGLIVFLSKIQKSSITSSPKIPAYLSTHPAVEDRISLLENLLLAGRRPAAAFRTGCNFKRIQARALVEEREPHSAIDHFQSLVNANPNDVDGYYGLGLAYRKSGRLDKATEVLERANALGARDPEILRELGIVYFLSGRLDTSIEVLESARSLFESGPDRNEDLMCLYSLGRGYQEKKDFAKALPLFLKVKEDLPEFGEVYLSLGSVYGRTGKKGLSHFYFGKHFKLRREKENALLHFRTALEWLEKGGAERLEAEREIKELTESKPPERRG